MVKILLHRVTTHKIHISTNDANFIHSQLITISRFSITCLNSTPQYKRKCSHFYYSISFVANSLSSTSLLLLGAFSGKVPCSITTKTYYFWQVLRFPFWATVEVVPWLLAPVTGDMTQVLPGIQSVSLSGPFHTNHGFYFLWVIFYFLCREFY